MKQPTLWCHEWPTTPDRIITENFVRRVWYCQLCREVLRVLDDYPTPPPRPRGPKGGLRLVA